MHELCKYIDKELKKLERKVEESGDLNEREIEYGKNLAKFKMAMLTNEAMERDSGYSNTGRSYGRPYYDDMDGGMSHARGARRDSIGRYSRNNGYSYADAKEDMMSELREIMKGAPDEETKQEFRDFIRKLERH